jgi:hypothetical protein
VSTPPNAGPPPCGRLGDHDKCVIGRGRQLAGLSGPAAVRARYGTTAVSYASTAHAYAEVFSQAREVIGDLLAIIERLAGTGACLTTAGERDEPPVPVPAGARVYEISFSGRAGDVLCAAFDDCAITIGPGMTTLRAQLPDQPALWSLVQRIASLGLELVELRRVAPRNG